MSKKSDSHASGILKWTEDSYLWTANTPPPVSVRDINLESKKCTGCGGRVDSQGHSIYSRESNSTYFTKLLQCSICGWYIEQSGWSSHSAHCQEIRGFFNLLKKFNLNDEEVSIRELGTFLKSNFSDVYNIPPRKLEQLVEDVFKNHGYRTRLTQQTRDGGADIILLDTGANQQAIVEVKRYSQNHTVGIQLVRQLLGAQMLLGARKSYLVTSSSFTSEAIKVPQSLSLKKHDIEVELWDGLRLLQELSCYNEKILPIKSINPEIPLHKQVPPELQVKKRLLRAPWAKFYGKRVSYIEGEKPPQ